jgi:hypothetical protein
VADSRLSSAPSGHGAPSVSASAACTTSARSVCVKSNANGHTVRVGVGWTIGLDLHTPNSVWNAPSEVGARLLRQTGGVRLGGGAAEVAYRAVAPGRTELRSSERPVCAPGHMCPQYILVWGVHIIVTGR